MNLEVVSLDTKFEVVFHYRMLGAGKQFYGTKVDLESLGDCKEGHSCRQFSHGSLNLS